MELATCGRVRTCVAALLVTSGGCMPFLLPPGEASIGGATAQRPVGRGAGQPGATAPSLHSGVTMRAGVHPLGALEEMRGRTVDFGVGYGYERLGAGDDAAELHAPYVELAAYPLRFGTSWQTRVGARTFGELLILPASSLDASPGVGATVALAVEINDFADGPFGGRDVAGLAQGEAGFGAFMGIGQRVVAGESYWIASAGISARVPIAAGVICCSVPKL